MNQIIETLPTVASMAEQTGQVRALVRSGQARELRIAAGLSLASAGREVQVGPDCIMRWERGEHTPRGRNVSAYYQFLAGLVAASRIPPERE